jgi:chromosome segregation ATPase
LQKAIQEMQQEYALKRSSDVEKLSLMHQENQSMKEQLHSLTTRTKHLSQEHDKARNQWDSDVQALRQQLEDHEQQKVELKDQLSSLVRERTRLKDNVISLEAKMDEERAAYEREVLKLKDQIKVYRRREREQRKELARVMSTFSDSEDEE